MISKRPLLGRLATPSGARVRLAAPVQPSPRSMKATAELGTARLPDMLTTVGTLAYMLDGVS